MINVVTSANIVSALAGTLMISPLDLMTIFNNNSNESTCTDGYTLQYTPVTPDSALSKMSSNGKGG